VTLIIGLGHRARQGKDYVSNYMKEALPSLISTYSFARELKLYCKEHHEELLTQWQLAHQTKQIPVCKSDPTYGYTAVLQWVGMKFRAQDENYWVKKVEDLIKEENPEIAVITDVRFPNEAAFVKEKGGYNIEVIRRLEDGTQFVDPGRDPNHISETALDNYNFDFIISVRDGDLEALKQKSIGVLTRIMQMEAHKEMDNALGRHVNSDATGQY
jgi:hypothetical protein